MKVLMRADASVSTGTGHAMRCLALAQALVDRGHQVVLATAELALPLERRFGAEAVVVARLDRRGPDSDLDQVRGLAGRMESEVFVVDGYQFDAEYVSGIGRAGRLLLIDDRGMAGLDTALVVNQNNYAAAADYPSRAPNTELLLGPRHALLRREFAASPPPHRAVGSPDRVLLTIGGSDPDDATRRLLPALRHVRELRVIIGPLHPDPQRLAGDVAAAGGTVITDTKDMRAQLTWADLVIGAAGTGALEFAWAGAPAVLVVTAENQEPVARSMERAGTAINLGSPDAGIVERLTDVLSALSADSQLLGRMSAAGRQLVDGRGASRVVTCMESAMTLRPATQRDDRILFEWANDPTVRAASFNTAPISWEEHQAWLQSRLEDPRTQIYVADHAGQPVGMSRFALDGTNAVISVSLASEARGRGLGERLIALASHRLFAETGATSIDAWIRPGNAASVHAFVAAGYMRRETRTTPASAPSDVVLLTYESVGRR